MDTVLTIPEKVIVWQFGGKSGNLTAQNFYSTENGGDGYNMLCKSTDEYLTYMDTTVGISLDFTSDSSLCKTHFRLPDGEEREILTGEKVALGIGGGDSFLGYTDRTIGINLDWFGDPFTAESHLFQWRIYGPTIEKGLTIPTGSWVALLNDEVEPSADFLVSLRRFGGNIGWTTSPDWKESVTDWLTEEAFKALINLLL